MTKKPKNISPTFSFSRALERQRKRRHSTKPHPPSSHDKLLLAPAHDKYEHECKCVRDKYGRELIPEALLSKQTEGVVFVLHYVRKEQSYFGTYMSYFEAHICICHCLKEE